MKKNNIHVYGGGRVSLLFKEKKEWKMMDYHDH